MPCEGGDASLTWDMLEAAESVLRMTAGMKYVEYQRDRKTRRAVEREVEIIGEAARGVSAGFAAAHPDIPWRKIIAQRHKLAHEYGEIQDEIMWKLVTVHVPELIEKLKPLVPEPPASNED